MRLIAFKNEVSERYREFYIDPPQVIVNTETTQFGDRIQGGEVAVLNPTGRQGVITLTGDDRLSRVLARSEALQDKSEWEQIDTWLEEFVETFQVAGFLAQDFQQIVDFVSTVEGY